MNGRVLGPPLLAALMACGTTPVPAPAGLPARPVVYGALPLRSLAGDPGAPAALLARLEAALSARGARFVPTDRLEALLKEHRIRYTDSVSAATADLIARETGADELVLGTLLAWEPGPTPRIALALRVIDTATGRRSLSKVVSLRGEDFAGLLHLGAIDDVELLADEVMARVLDGFDERGRPLPVVPRPDTDTGPGGADVRFLADGFHLADVDRVAVLPLANRSGRQEAGLLYSEILGHAWFTVAGIDVVERSELMEALVATQVRSVDALDLEVLAKVGRLLGTRWFALGSIDRFAEDVRVERDVLPALEASIRLVDVQTGRTVAATALHRRGDDYHRLLGLGTVRDGITLVARSATEIVANLGG